MEISLEQVIETLLPEGYKYYDGKGQVYDYVDPITGELKVMPSGIERGSDGVCCTAYKKKAKYVSIVIFGVLEDD